MVFCIFLSFNLCIERQEVGCQTRDPFVLRVPYQILNQSSYSCKSQRRFGSRTLKTIFFQILIFTCKFLIYLDPGKRLLDGLTVNSFLLKILQGCKLTSLLNTDSQESPTDIQESPIEQSLQMGFTLLKENYNPKGVPRQVLHL